MPLTPAGGSFTRALNRGVTEQKHTFKLFDAERSGYRLKAQTALWNRTLVVCWNDIPLYAGVIYDRDYDYDNDVLTIVHGDIRGTVLARRFTFGSSGYEASGFLSLINSSYRGLASRLVQAALVGPTSNYDLPIVRTSTSEVGTRSRRWRDFNLPNVSSELDELQTVDGGPDVDFDPEWSDAQQLQWNMRTGSPAFPAITGSTFEFNMTVQEKAFRNLKFREDGSRMATTVYAVGDGSEQKMLVARAATSSNLPALDRIQTYKQIDNATELASHAQADLASFTTSTRQWSMDYDGAGVVDDDGNQLLPTIAQLKLGSILRLYFAEHPWMPEGWTNLRLIGYTARTDSTMVTLDVQEIDA